jgi:hypothetical protein
MLETIMSDISVGVGPRRHDITMQVVPGRDYRMQVLLSENFWGHVAGFENGQREQDFMLFSGDFDINIDGAAFNPVALGRTIYARAANVNVRAETAGLANPLNAGVVVTLEFTAVEPLLTLWATPPASPSGVDDTISIINAITVEDLTVSPVRGDVDGDLLVTIDDFMDYILVNFRKTNATPEQGDLNLDGKIEFADFFIWRDEFLHGGGSPQAVQSAAASLTVPEPASFWLLAGSAALVALRRRRGRRRSSIVL